ncbi:MAG: response regulator [Firmicutes bacterium]|nr:response regulator [Bacillota bacterium]
MYRVVIADDERAIRTGLQIVVDWNRLGFEIAGCAQNGEEALQMMLRQKIDVLLADIRMPGLDGLQLAKKVQELELPAEIVLISGYRDFEYARQAVSLGVRDYLLKPVDEVALQELFRRICADLDERSQAETGQQERLLVSQVRSMIAEQYQQDISLKSVAERLNYNPAYLGRLFRNETGNSFRDELNVFRVRQAAKLLQESHIRAYEAAERVGYRDVNYFYRVFREIYGVSPGEYKTGQRTEKI